MKIPIPGEFIVVVGATLAAYLGEFHSKYGVRVVGEAPSGFMPVDVPSWSSSLLSQLINDAIALSIITFMVRLWRDFLPACVLSRAPNV